MTHTSRFKTLLFCAICLISASCEKPVINEDNSEITDTDKNTSLVTVNFKSFTIEQSAFTDTQLSATNKSVTNVKELCKVINVAIFDENNNKAKTINQDRTNKSFGNISITLPKGTYKIIVIAHNGGGNATISSPTKITFKDNKVTDTFHYYGTLEITDDVSYNLVLKRAVAMFRLTIKDSTPSSVKYMKFYYTGGSSTFDATSGYGCVNSKQTEIRTVENSAYTEGSCYEIYTFPHETDKKLKIEVSALDKESSSSPIYQKTFSDVPVKTNMITNYTGVFFGEDSGGGRSLYFDIDGEWQSEDYEY